MRKNNENMKVICKEENVKMYVINRKLQCRHKINIKFEQ